jgi:hypothetical protein
MNGLAPWMFDDDDDDIGILSCNAVLSCRWVQPFGGTIDSVLTDES